jgi:hypothetical protein
MTRPRKRLLLPVIAAVIAATGAVPAAHATGTVPAAAAGAPPPISFAGAKYYTAGLLRSASLDGNGTARADLDGDGHGDVAMIAPWLGSRVDIMWGKGDGTFKTPAQQLWAGVLNSNVILGDFNRDGRVDLAVTGSSSFTVVINDGGRRFHTGATYVLQQSPFQNAGVTDDFNGDSNLDLVLKTPLGLQTMYGKGNGTFSYGPFSYVAGVPGALASLDDADLDNDGRRDVVAADAATQQVFALRNAGDGSFTVKSQVSVPVVPTTVRTGDLNHTGVDSIVVLPEVSPPNRSAAVVLNDGAGNLRLLDYYPAGFANPVGDLGDFNGDGNLDIVSVNTFSGNIVLLAGRGDGTFQPAGTFGTSINAQTPAVADFNHDGRADIGVPVQCPGLSGLIGNVCLAVLINQS